MCWCGRSHQIGCVTHSESRGTGGRNCFISTGGAAANADEAVIRLRRARRRRAQGKYRLKSWGKLRLTLGRRRETAEVPCFDGGKTSDFSGKDNFFFFSLQ